MSYMEFFVIAGLLGLGALIIILAFLLIITGRTGGLRGRTGAEETRLIQEMHHQTIELEKRIESLEAILIEKENNITDKT